MKASYLRMTGAVLLAMILISFVWGGIAWAGGRSGRVERAVDAASNDKDIMPATPFSNPDAITRKIAEINKQAEFDAENIVYEKQNAKLTLHEPGKGGPTSSGGHRGGGTVEKDAYTINTTVVDSTSYNIAIGTGKDPKTDASGRLISEVIDGTRVVYAGFENVGTTGPNCIEDAIDRAEAGDRVIVAGGTYNEFITVKNGVSMYGGYKENGTRGAEINGFTLNQTNGGYLIRASGASDMVIANNTINGIAGGRWIEIREKSKNILIKNNIINYGGAALTVSSSSATITNNIFNNCNLFATTHDTFPAPVNLVINNNSFYGSGRIEISPGAGMVISSSNNKFYAASGMPAKSTPWLETTTSKQKTTKETASRQRIASYTPDPKNIHPGAFSISDPNTGKTYTIAMVVNALKDLMNSKDAGGQFGSSQKELAAKITVPTSGQSALAVPIEGISGDKTTDFVEVSALLANIIKNPTEEQKQILDAVEELLAGSEDIAAESKELASASEAFVTIMAAIIVAQAMPDILKEGDMAAIRDAFTEFKRLNTEAAEKYQVATKEYYDDMRHIIEKNSAALDTNGLLTKELLEKGLSNLPRQEIDRLMRRIRLSGDKSEEVQHILQEDAKLRAKHDIDKAYAAFIKDMTVLLNSFTKRFYDLLSAGGVLKTKKQAKEGPIPVPELPVK